MVNMERIVLNRLNTTPNEASLTDDIIEAFVNGCMDDLLAALGTALSFQGRAAKTGEMFEEVFYILMKDKFNINLARDYAIPRACLCGGGELDFALVRDNQLKCGIEAKGSAIRIGNRQLPRPALMRTDTVKKAISNAYQFKRIYPTLPFYIVTNVKPTSGNAQCMCNLAEGDIVNQIVDITDKDELLHFVVTLKNTP